MSFSSDLSTLTTVYPGSQFFPLNYPAYTVKSATTTNIYRPIPFAPVEIIKAGKSKCQIVTYICPLASAQAGVRFVNRSNADDQCQIILFPEKSSISCLIG